MKVLITLAVIVLLLVVVGVMHFSKSEDQVNVTIDTGKVEDAAEKAVETGKQAVGAAGEAVQEAGDEFQEEFREEADEPGEPIQQSPDAGRSAEDSRNG